MENYHYAPPKFKNATKMIDVFDERDNIVCRFQRVYKNGFVRFINAWQGFDWYTQVNVYAKDGERLYYCQKYSKWRGHPTYDVVNCQTNEVYHVTATGVLNVAQQFLITNGTHEFTMKMSIADTVQFFHADKVVATWTMKATKLFKTDLNIDVASPIQDPAFFVGLFQCIYYIGN